MNIPIPIELPKEEYIISSNNIRSIGGSDNGFIIDLPGCSNAFYVYHSMSKNIYVEICAALTQGKDIRLFVMNGKIDSVDIVDPDEESRNRLIAAGEF